MKNPFHQTSILSNKRDTSIMTVSCYSLMYPIIQYRNSSALR